MNSDIGMCIGLLAVMSLVACLFFLAGRRFPAASCWLACIAFVFVLCLWTLLALDDADGPGGALGMVIIAAGSLLCLSVGVGLFAGAKKSASPIVGLGLGIASSGALHVWFVPYASLYAGAALLLFFCIGGIVHQPLRKSQQRARGCVRRSDPVD